MTAKEDRAVGERCGRHHKFPRGRKPGDLCFCGKTRLCNQCYRARALRLFGKRLKNCGVCAKKWGRGGYRRAEPRRGLPTAGEARYTWSARSGNAKLGPIPTCIASADSCPPSCSWYGNGCFAEYDVLAHHWRQTQPGKRGITFAELLERVRALPRGKVWRYATAGDLPGPGTKLDADALGELVLANAGRRGFTFTHKPTTAPLVRRVLEMANRAGFTINLSADTLEQADELSALGIAPVAVVLPLKKDGEDPQPAKGADLRTPAGRRIVVCPAETRGLTCAVCQLCTRANRKGIVGFYAHGQAKRAVSEVASGKRRLPMLGAAE